MKFLRIGNGSDFEYSSSTAKVIEYIHVGVPHSVDRSAGLSTSEVENRDSVFNIVNNTIDSMQTSNIHNGIRFSYHPSTFSGILPIKSCDLTFDNNVMDMTNMNFGLERSSSPQFCFNRIDLHKLKGLSIYFSYIFPPINETPSSRILFTNNSIHSGWISTSESIDAIKKLPFTNQEDYDRLKDLFTKLSKIEIDYLGFLESATGRLKETVKFDEYEKLQKEYREAQKGLADATPTIATDPISFTLALNDYLKVINKFAKREFIRTDIVTD